MSCRSSPTSVHSRRLAHRCSFGFIKRSPASEEEILWAVRGNKAKKEKDSDEKKKENGKEGRNCSLGIVLTKALDCQGRRKAKGTG